MSDSLPYDPEAFDEVPEPPRAGLSIGPYRLLRPIGRGGMSQVYEAIHEEIGQKAAVKLLSARLSRRGSARQRFLNEAKAGSSVHHPSLVKIFDYGSIFDGIPYILMEYLEGSTLRVRLARQADGRISIIETLRLGRQVAAALTAAHDRGVVHRDLKPENLMIIKDPETPGGERVMVLDFGIAKFVQAPDHRTDPAGGPLGTPTYMSPEQCRGDDRLDGRSDVYSLGVVLYELLCGRPPFLVFAGNPAHVTFQHIWADPKPLQNLRRQIPEELQKLVLGMLEKNHQKRPLMADVERMLERLLSKTRPARTSGIPFASAWLPLGVFAMLMALTGGHYDKRACSPQATVHGMSLDGEQSSAHYSLFTRGSTLSKQPLLMCSEQDDLKDVFQVPGSLRDEACVELNDLGSPTFEVISARGYKHLGVEMIKPPPLKQSPSLPSRSDSSDTRIPRKGAVKAKRRLNTIAIHANELRIPIL